MIDEILDFFEDLTGWFEDKFSWFTDLFEGLLDSDGFSWVGAIFGICGAGIIFLLRDRIVTPFTQYMSPVEGMFWEVATYGACIIVGYKIAQKMLDD